MHYFHHLKNTLCISTLLVWPHFSRMVKKKKSITSFFLILSSPQNYKCYCQIIVLTLMLSEPLDTLDHPLLSPLLKHNSHLIFLLQIACLILIHFSGFSSPPRPYHIELPKTVPRIHSFSILTPLRSSFLIRALNKICILMPLKCLSAVLTSLLNYCSIWNLH